MVKIALVADSLPGLHQRWSGAELVCLRLGEGLRENGHDVLFMTPPFDTEADIRNAYPIATPFLQRGLWSGIFPLDLVAVGQALALFRRERPNLVHLHSKRLFVSALLAGTILGIPAILTVLDYNLVCLQNNLRTPRGQICFGGDDASCARCVGLARPTKSSAKTWARRMLVMCRRRLYRRFSVQLLAAIITLSRTSKTRLETHGVPGDKISVIYHYSLPGRDQISYAPTISSNSHTVLFVGSLYEHKGLHVVIDAMRQVVNQIPESRLLVIGTSEDHLYRHRLQDLISDLGLQQSVEFLGQRDNEEVMGFIDASDVVVVAEQWPSDFGPVILVEALSCGKPVVAGRIGSAPEFIEDGRNGYLVDHDQPEQFAERLTCLLQRPGLAQAMGEAAMRSVDFLRQRDWLKQVGRLYESVVAKKNERG